MKNEGLVNEALELRGAVEMERVKEEGKGGR
jgi:hypothetical protein